jgi:hypothetical protein
MSHLRLAALSLVMLLLGRLPADAYSVLTHEAMIDALWDVKIKPLLLAHYPQAGPEELKRAHGFAYGGAIIQDLGYYPGGSKQFSDLTHYVRTGDFILALINESGDLNELAFSLGALSHYLTDLDGHRYATNVGEPILYPDLRKKFGDVITYEQDPTGHLKTEFGFDVLEVAKGRFAPQAYHDFIGFYVAKDVLARGFHDTYGLEITDLFGNYDRAIDAYRSAVSHLIPKATRIAWAQKKDEIRRSEPGITHRRFVYIMKRSSYEREWGKRLDGPSTWDKVLAFLLRLLPPVGPLKALQLKMPTPEVEQLFLASFNRAASQYRVELEQTANQTLKLEDKNYDVGVPTPAGVYRLKDNVEAFWLHKLAEKHFAGMTPAIKGELLSFYSNLNAPIATKQNPQEWERTLAELAQLRMVQAAPTE